MHLMGSYTSHGCSCFSATHISGKMKTTNLLNRQAQSILNYVVDCLIKKGVTQIVTPGCKLNSIKGRMIVLIHLNKINGKHRFASTDITGAQKYATHRLALEER